ncbi:hypothetical protein [Leptothoe spongobia]|uniref:Uncharacterized protein n=1 Tax=Leptothoe spongobia TAU-MAC 1115 TaxID=1967444 RepID=A0A947DHK8_9CYAN|nr:hypothetical protein [Leptothoe spongobia]MBT9317090.1 hypothetical protein [Leptothoe spongobia TAU-MAC 1115]
MQEFIPETYTPPPTNAPAPQPTREPVLITIIGSTPGLSIIIQILHRLGFAEAGAWSKPQIDPKSGKPMRVLKKWIRL